MLRNFIQDSDLRQYYPKLSSQLWSVQTDYQNQIGQAFNNLLADLWNRGVDPRDVMVPVSLKAVGAETASVIGSGVEVPNNRRFTVDITAYSGSAEIDLDGSHDKLTWDTLLTAVVTGSASGEYSSVIDNKYKYYRYQSRITGSMTYAVSMYETAFDNVIVHGTFRIIFRDFTKEPNDVWDLKRQLEEKDYENALAAVKYYYDANENQIIDDAELQSQGMTINIVR